MSANYNPYTLVGKTILITGASSGIGRGVAIECSRLGAKLIVTARNEERLKATLDSLEGDGHKMVLCDLNDIEAIKKMIDLLPEVQGVVNNAGFTKIVPIPFIKEKGIEDILHLNTIAPIMILSLLVKKKKISKGASVVFTSSLAGLGKISVGNCMYAASKGAISSFIRGAAKELAEKGIRVNAVCPGMVDTGILDSGTVSKEQLNVDRKRYPLKRYGKPEDIAWAMIYLLSEASSWVTGTNMIIDGGISL